MNFQIDLNANSIKAISPNITVQPLEMNEAFKESSHSPVTPYALINDDSDNEFPDTNSSEYIDEKSDEWFPLEDNPRFSVGDQIEETMQGGIYKALDLKYNNLCVIKSADAYLIDCKQNYNGQAVTEDFIKERKIMFTLSQYKDIHPGIIKCLDSWEDAMKDTYFYAMEYCPNGLFDYTAKHFKENYKEFVENGSNKPQQTMIKANNWTKKVQNLFRQMVEAVQWLHSKKVCHLDLSVENVMMANNEKEPKIKIIDFGMSVQFDNDSDDTFIHRGVVGKRQYCAPEVYAKNDFDAQKADVYSLGVCLFLMLTGQRPYNAPIVEDSSYAQIANGNLKGLLIENKRLRLVTEEALDLMHKMMRSNRFGARISITDVLNHSFLKQ